MSTLQWALLLLGVGVAAALVLWSRRERRAREHEASAAAPRLRVGDDWSPQPAARQAEGAGRSFDEFGVGRPRRRQAPDIGALPAETDDAAKGAATMKRAANVPEKLIGLYIAEHEGTTILGPKIHAALQDQGLSFGAHRIYHRIEAGRPLFSVASLVKPGHLDPAEAEGFSTPGLSVFLVLPGPPRPLAAFEEMLATARALARALNAQLFDSEQRVLLTVERERALHAEVEDWARRHA